MIKQKLLLLAMAILGIGGFIYFKKSRSTTNRISDFIPDNTLVLLETNEISSVKNSIIPRVPLLTNASSQYQILKSIGLSQKDINLLVLKKTLFFALLPEGKDNVAFVNYLPLTSENDAFIEKLNKLSQNNTGKRIIPHTTQGIKVSEVIDEQAQSLFAFIVKDDFLIFSKSNLALEESILHTENNWIKALKLHDSGLKSDSIFTETHFNRNSINNFLKGISVKNAVNFSSIFPENFEWLKPNSNSIEAISTATKSNLFEDQKSLNLQSLNMIPNSCSYSLIMSFSNKEKLISQLEKGLENNKKASLLREKINSKFEVEFEKIYDKISDEITLCSFDNSDQNLNNKVLIIKQKGLLNPLKVISSKVASESKDNVFSVQYGSFLITSLGIKEFPMVLFGEIYGGFEECYFTEYNNYVILSSNLTTMQEYLVAISKGEVWSNSPKSKKILSHCLPANLTLIAENSKALVGLEKVLNTKWANKINTHKNSLSGIQAEILQMSSTEARLVLLNNIELNKTILKNNYKWVKLGGINIINSSKPIYLLNPQNKVSQILVQSADNKLNLIENGKIVWSYPLNDKLVGDIKSIKYSKGLSQELIVVTKSKLFILTRENEGFDVIESQPFKGFNLENYSILENESDKQKSLTLISGEGSSFKFNKASLTLLSTSSTKNNGQTLTPMPSIIQNGSEYVVVLEKTGKLFLQNAKGKVASNFPININGNFSSPPHLEGENKNLVIRMISEQGDLFKVSLDGKILEKKQLYRPNNEAKFSMAVDDRNSDWVLMRTDGKEVVVLDKTEKEILVITGLNYGKKVLGYYNLGIAGKYFSINNGYETYKFYNENGEGIGQIPIESIFKPSLSYSDSYKKIIMNITKPSSIETWSVKIR